MSAGQQDAVQHAGTMVSRLARHTPQLSLKSTYGTSSLVCSCAVDRL